MPAQLNHVSRKINTPKLFGRKDVRISVFAILHKNRLHFFTAEKMTALTILSTIFRWHEQCTRLNYMIRGMAAAERQYQSRQAARPVIAAVLLKIAKHMALVACLLLIGKSRGEPILGPPATLLIIITAALIDFLGRRLQIGPAPRDRFLRGGG